jgi:hypothetical protein
MDSEKAASVLNRATNWVMVVVLESNGDGGQE